MIRAGLEHELDQVPLAELRSQYTVEVEKAIHRFGGADGIDSCCKDGRRRRYGEAGHSRRPLGGDGDFFAAVTPLLPELHLRVHEPRLHPAPVRCILFHRLAVEKMGERRLDLVVDVE